MTEYEPTLGEVEAALAPASGYTPGSRYGRHSDDHLELAYGVAIILANLTGNLFTIEGVESVLEMTVNDSPDPAVTMLEYGEVYGFDPLEYLGVESESVPHNLATELDDDVAGPWTVAAVDALAHADICRWRDGGHEELEYALRAAYDESTRDVRERFRAWDRLREAGHGQLTIDGGEVVLPAPPEAYELYAFTVRAGGLSPGIDSIMEDGPEDAELERALATLEGPSA